MKFKLLLSMIFLLIIGLLGYVLVINDRLSLDDITKAITDQGLEVTVGDFMYDDVVLKNSKQHMITINPPTAKMEKPEIIGVYIFNSKNRREQGAEEWRAKQLFTDWRIVPKTYQIKNVLMIYWSEADFRRPPYFDEQIQKAVNQLKE